jgi:hypothetical protein
MLRIDAPPQFQNFLTGNYTGFFEKLASRFFQSASLSLKCRQAHRRKPTAHFTA